MTDSVGVAGGADSGQLICGSDLVVALWREEIGRDEVSSRAWREPVAKAQLYEILKRFLDIVGGVAGLVILSPLILVVVLITKLTGNGPVLYRHSRVGLRGQEFTCYKFRTMVPNADEMKSDIHHNNHHGDDRTFKIP